MTVYMKRGSVTRSYHNHEDGSFTLATSQDLEETIEHNKMLRENIDMKATHRLVARVPLHVAEKAMREGWLHDEDKWKQWLNDADNRDHRVWEGNI